MNKKLIKRIAAIKRENLQKIKSINTSIEEKNRFATENREAVFA